jgi:hypothetical protein
LLALLRSVEGGVAAVAEQILVTPAALYKLSQGQHRALPRRLLAQLAPLLGKSFEELARMWKETKATAGDR